MQRRRCLQVLVLIGLAVALALSGCAKKEVQTVPSGAEPGRSDVERQAPSAEEGAEGDMAVEGEEQRVDEYGLTEEERAARAEEEDRKMQRSEAMEELQTRIHFAFDSYELRSEARKILQRKAELLQQFPELDMVIEGHCDERGTDEYNLALGERRARAAYELLIILGVDADRLSIISYGEEKPLVEGHNETAWAKNRRAEFRIIESETGSS